jgi:hypothetical protein
MRRELQYNDFTTGWMTSKQRFDSRQKLQLAQTDWVSYTILKCTARSFLTFQQANLIRMTGVYVLQRTDSKLQDKLVCLGHVLLYVPRTNRNFSRCWKF